MSDDLNFAKESPIWVRIYEHLKEKIIFGEIAPDEHLVEASIAKDLGISRTPVREALHNMQKDGLVESIPRVGYRVKPVTKEEVFQACRIRAVLEVLATEWAIEHGKKVLLEQLNENISSSKRALLRGKLDEFPKLDAQFHEIISRRSGSDIITQLIRSLRNSMFRFRMDKFYFGDVAENVIKGHQAIYEAINKGRKSDIKKTLNEHLDIAFKAILKIELDNISH